MCAHWVSLQKGTVGPIAPRYFENKVLIMLPTAYWERKNIGPRRTSHPPVCEYCFNGAFTLTVISWCDGAARLMLEMGYKEINRIVYTKCNMVWYCGASWWPAVRIVSCTHFIGPPHWHHGVSSGWSSVWHRSNTGLSSTQYEQIPIILGIWPFWLTPFFFRSITFWRAYG